MADSPKRDAAAPPQVTAHAPVANVQAPAGSDARLYPTQDALAKAGERLAAPMGMAPAMHPGMMMSALHGMPAMQAEPMAKPASKPKKVKKEEPPPEPVERPKRARKAPKKQEDYEVFKDDEGDERLDPE